MCVCVCVCVCVLFAYVCVCVHACVIICSCVHMHQYVLVQSICIYVCTVHKIQCVCVLACTMGVFSSISAVLKCVRVWADVQVYVHTHPMTSTTNCTTSHNCPMYLRSLLPVPPTQLLKCPSSQLDGSLTHRTLEARGDVVRTELTVEQGFYGRDAFAKAIYERVFLWLVERLNSSLENKVCMYMKSLCSTCVLYMCLKYVHVHM